MTEWKQEYTRIAVPESMWRSAQAVNEAYNKVLMFALNPNSPEAKAHFRDMRASRERAWAENTTKGLVGLVDHGDTCNGCPSEYELATDRTAYVDAWVKPEAWERYVEARDAYDHALEEMLK